MKNNRKFGWLALLLVLIMTMCALTACNREPSNTTGTTDTTGTTESPAPSKITVIVNIYANGELGESGSIEVASGTTLKALFESEINPGGSFEETLSYTTWEVNGAAATATTVLKNGDVVTANVTMGGAGDEGDVTFTMQITMNGVTDSETYSVPEGTTFGAFYEGMSDGQISAADFLAAWSCTINGAPLTADTVLNNGDVIVAVLQGQGGEGGGEDVGGEVAKVTVTLVPLEGTSMSMDFPLTAGMTLAEFFELYLGNGAKFEDSLTNTKWEVNGEAATADTVLAEGDVIVGTQLPEGGSGNEGGGSATGGGKDWTDDETKRY